MRYKVFGLMMLALGLGVLARTPDLAKVGDTVDARIESPHPVSGFWRQDVDVPGATFLKLHLADMHLGDGDLLLITDAYGQEVYSRTGPVTQEGWLPMVDGDHLTIEVWPAQGSTARGLTVDKVAQGIAAPSPESICGVDDSLNAACYQFDAGKWAAGDAVGCMLFQMGGGSDWYACTGSLVSPYNHFLTNNHCIANEQDASTLEVYWRYQVPSCGVGTATYAPVSRDAHLLLTDADYDFSLLTFCNDTPSQRYGNLQLNSVLPSVGDVLWIAQHPGGDPKRFAVVSDMDGGGNAKVQSVNITGNVTGSDIGYYADTRPGSSGSPVLDANNTVIALHHFGIGSASCSSSLMNSGVKMSKIYPMISSLIAGPSSCDVPPPVISGVVKVVNPPPLKLKISGSNFHTACTIKIDGQAVPLTQFKSATLIKAKGSGLKTMLPKGVTVQITVVNNDDGGISASFPYTR
jgi:hypothetical protein